MTIQGSPLETQDGRQARSHRTRAAVAEAMLDCLEDGVLQPSAKEVAERAGVSTRAVFRHFEKMEALLEETAQLQIQRVTPQLPPIVTEGSLDDRLDALLLHSVRRNELIAPVHRASVLSEPFSEVIRQRRAWMNANVRKQVRAVFKSELNRLSETGRGDRIAAISALLAFSYWDELRRHSKLSVASASRVLRGCLQSVLVAD